MIERDRQYWLWVTRPDYYLDEDGSDREDLDPNSGVDSDGGNVGGGTCGEIGGGGRDSLVAG